MTDFKSWLEGYLEGKETLNKEQIELIKQKASEPPDLVSVPSIWPIYQPSPTWSPKITCTGTKIEPEMYC